MRLIRTPHEAIIEGSVTELANIGDSITRIRPASCLAFPAQENESAAMHLKVTEDAGLFCASWHPDEGLLIRGRAAALSSFAELFHFNCEPFPGLHTHWDVAGILDFVDVKTLPIVIQVG